jgi:hypothetical protein
VPVILTQHYSSTDRVYEDAEFSLYHYPRVYFSRVEAYDRFVYYRPLGKSTRRIDSLHYFGHGILGKPFPDPGHSDHRFVPLIKAEPFPKLVPLRDLRENFFETETASGPQFQAAVRRMSEVAYHRILAAADVVSTSLDTLPSTEAVSPFYLTSNPTAPRDTFRTIIDIPPGAGYVPRDTIVDVYESAALQERARADHQAILKRISVLVHASGGTCSYNNNVDLLAEHGDRRTLIEAKSLTDLRDAVDRMRYGIGQLADYAHRYRAELRGAQSTLAFGRPPDRQTGWIADVLQANAIAFVALDGNAVVPMNEAARSLPFMAPRERSFERRPDTVAACGIVSHPPPRRHVLTRRRLCHRQPFLGKKTWHEFEASFETRAAS